MSNPERPWDQKPQETTGPVSKVKLWQWVVGGLIVVGIFGAISGMGGDEPDEFGAQVACEDRVKKLLKAPASADFSGTEAVSIGTNTWEVTGVVDSDNSFGASIRGTFTCQAESDDGEMWTTSRVSID